MNRDEQECLDQFDPESFDSEAAKTSIRQIKCAFYELVISQIKKIRSKPATYLTEDSSELPLQRAQHSEGHFDELSLSASATNRSHEPKPIGLRIYHSDGDGECNDYKDNGHKYRSRSQKSRSPGNTTKHYSAGDDFRCKSSESSSPASVCDESRQNSPNRLRKSEIIRKRSSNRNTPTEERTSQSTSSSQSPSSSNNHRLFQNTLSVLMLVLLVWLLLVSGAYIGIKFCSCFPKNCACFGRNRVIPL